MNHQDIHIKYRNKKWVTNSKGAPCVDPGGLLGRILYNPARTARRYPNPMFIKQTLWSKLVLYRFYLIKGICTRGLRITIQERGIRLVILNILLGTLTIENKLVSFPYEEFLIVKHKQIFSTTEQKGSKWQAEHPWLTLNLFLSSRFQTSHLNLKALTCYTRRAISKEKVQMF